MSELERGVAGDSESSVIVGDIGIRERWYDTRGSYLVELSFFFFVKTFSVLRSQSYYSEPLVQPL